MPVEVLSVQFVLSVFHFIAFQDKKMAETGAKYHSKINPF